MIVLVSSRDNRDCRTVIQFPALHCDDETEEYKEDGTRCVANINVFADALKTGSFRGAQLVGCLAGCLPACPLTSRPVNKAGEGGGRVGGGDGRGCGVGVDLHSPCVNSAIENYRFICFLLHFFSLHL